MEIPNAVRCMRHCSSDYNIFYVDFPEFCPICGKEMKGSFLVVPPFCVPHPFRASHEAPYSLVVKPTEGCFLSDYHSGNDLHIGITNSSGMVYNYDQNGVHVDRQGWSSCVVVSLTSIHHSQMMVPLAGNCQDWDIWLENHSKKTEWAVNRYHAQSHNCYNFVLSFLQTLQPSDEDFQSKEAFCKRFIVPLTTRAAQYIDLRRTILRNGPSIRRA